ncbi:Protein CBG21485 [Caenorhabditis briggsae]|uniref:Protein CBG21485 n=1 Tax=Caenorhabditis briggsae TaxID=6238 RepID=A8Y052_CAEBR|nr:Protein CBG21485 [Caenorhabditis briggsae]CAP38270.2 Protein CBG21485 [Caenorhabditis briggsae]
MVVDYVTDLFNLEVHGLLPTDLRRLLSSRTTNQGIVNQANIQQSGRLAKSQDVRYNPYHGSRISGATEGDVGPGAPQHTPMPQPPLSYPANQSVRNLPYGSHLPTNQVGSNNTVI